MPCIDLLTESRRLRVKTVDRYRFSEMLPESQQFITGWARRAIKRSNCKDFQTFEPFIFGWIALNGWASCATSTENESMIVESLMFDSYLNQHFASELSAGDTELAECSKQFHKLWPFVRAKDGVCVDAGHNERLRFVYQYQLTHPSVKFKPDCATKHYEKGEEIPLDWPHTIQAIYQVRCNLFHGSKSVHFFVDSQIVSSAFSSLW